MNNQKRLQAYHQRRDKLYVQNVQNAQHVDDAVKEVQKFAQWTHNFRHYLDRLSKTDEMITNFLGPVEVLN